MPGLTKSSYGSGDTSWLGSAHGIRNGRSSVLQVSAFTAAEHYPDGYIPSGTPVDASDESALKPWTGSGSLGFVLFDQTVTGDEDINVPVLRHGTIKTALLPVDFDVPAAGAAGFVFIEGSDG